MLGVPEGHGVIFCEATNDPNNSKEHPPQSLIFDASRIDADGPYIWQLIQVHTGAPSLPRQSPARSALQLFVKPYGLAARLLERDHQGRLSSSSFLARPELAQLWSDVVSLASHPEVLADELRLKSLKARPENKLRRIGFVGLSPDLPGNIMPSLLTQTKAA